MKDNYNERRLSENVANESSQKNMSLYIWFVKHRIIIFIEVFAMLGKLEGPLFIVIHESKGETPFRNQG